MRWIVFATSVAVLVGACDTQTPVASPSPTGSISARPSSSSPVANGCTAVASSYGLMLGGGRLTLVAPSGCLGPGAAVASPSGGSCPSGVRANLAPPVSASTTRVYYRDGDATIRSLALDGTVSDVTSVPGGPTTVSFFAVSPDDQRIAVLVEDLATANAIKLRLYVEDLVGHGHHADIYLTTIAESGGLTPWPTGWLGNNVVLALVPACSPEPAHHPTAWHVVDSATADRLVNIDTSVCLSTLIASAGGIACATPNTSSAYGHIKIYNWSGSLIWDAVNADTNMDRPAGVSPSGTRIFVNANTVWNFCPVEAVAGNCDQRYMKPPFACVWIDDSTVLTDGSVVDYPLETMHNIATNGDCVGRFPGGL